MAKLFYTLAETGERLGKTEEEVREMGKSGILEEMRDGDQVMFKRKQVDLLVGDGGLADDLDLDLSGGGSSFAFGLSDSDADSPAQSGGGLSNSGEEHGSDSSSSGFGDSFGSGFGTGFGTGFGDGLDSDESGAGSAAAASNAGNTPAEDTNKESDVASDNGPLGDESRPDSSGYGLSDSGTGMGLAGSSAGLDLGGSGFGFDLGESGGGSGFDLGDSGSSEGLDLGVDSHADDEMDAVFEGGEDDDSAETRVADAVDEELSLEAVGSGSGLLDLTRESDDTSLGAELLDEVWEGEESGEFGVSASGLFESVEPDQAVASSSDAPMGLAVAVAEAYDGKWSGAGVGFLVGAMFSLVAVFVMLLTSIMGVSPKLGAMITGDLMIWGGGFAALAIVAGLVGMFIGKASE